MNVKLKTETDLFLMRHKLAKYVKKALRKQPSSSKYRISLLDETRPGRPLPFVPAEIWSIIFGYATDDPLNTSSSPISFVDSRNLDLCSYLASMQVKLNLALVSHVWYAHLEPYLYESVWIHRSSQARRLAFTLLSEDQQELSNPLAEKPCSRGRFIKRLFIETSSISRCDAADVRTILEYATHLEVYADHRSLRRSIQQDVLDPRSSPEQLFTALSRSRDTLRSLSWTTYDHDIPFHQTIAPLLESCAPNLEYLELTMCSPFYSQSHCYPSVSLLCLKSLKITLDNDTFASLAHWNLPSLTNLSVVSSDFNYSGPGFTSFFHSHGKRITQLELGHSSSALSEHDLTSPIPERTIPLADWCPNLVQFVCSADAEWNWRSPDWIAPHVLLPRHPNLEFIGIKNIDKRLAEDARMYGRPGDVIDDTPFFRLMTQISSLNRDAFPRLTYVRDLSEESDRMRSQGGGYMPGGPSAGGVQPRVVNFWVKVLNRCKQSGVWLEDVRGVNLIQRDLKKMLVE